MRTSGHRRVLESLVAVILASVGAMSCRGANTTPQQTGDEPHAVGARTLAAPSLTIGFSGLLDFVSDGSGTPSKAWVLVPNTEEKMPPFDVKPVHYPRLQVHVGSATITSRVVSQDTFRDCKGKQYDGYRLDDVEVEISGILTTMSVDRGSMDLLVPMDELSNYSKTNTIDNNLLSTDVMSEKIVTRWILNARSVTAKKA